MESPFVWDMGQPAYLLASLEGHMDELKVMSTDWKGLEMSVSATQTPPKSKWGELVNPDLKRLYQATEDNPMDWDTRLILADALEEHDLQILAFGQRWMGRNQKAPLYRMKVFPKAKYAWGWYCDSDSWNKMISKGLSFTGYLPPNLIDIIRLMINRRYDNHGNYPLLFFSQEEAEMALTSALWQMKMILGT